jgi:hypothetical protein
MGLQPQDEGLPAVMLRLDSYLDRPGVRLDPELVELAKSALATLLLGGSPSAEGGSARAAASSAAAPTESLISRSDDTRHSAGTGQLS